MKLRRALWWLALLYFGGQALLVGVVVLLVPVVGHGRHALTPAMLSELPFIESVAFVYAMIAAALIAARTESALARWIVLIGLVLGAVVVGGSVPNVLLTIIVLLAIVAYRRMHERVSD